MHFSPCHEDIYPTACASAAASNLLLPLLGLAERLTAQCERNRKAGVKLGDQTRHGTAPTGSMKVGNSVQLCVGANLVARLPLTRICKVEHFGWGLLQVGVKSCLAAVAGLRRLDCFALV